MGMTIGNNVQKLLNKRGWTPYRLGKESGVSMTVIYGLKEKNRGQMLKHLLNLQLL